MADDNSLRSLRPNDPLRRDAAPASERDRSNDPLVELARLIGQSDPFAEFGRGKARDAEGRRDSPPPPADVPNWRGSPPPYALMRAKVAPSAPPLQPVVSAPPVAGYADDLRYAPRYAPEAQDSRADRVPLHHEDVTYDDANYAAAAQDGPEHDGPYPDDAAAAEQHEEAIYDDPPRKRRHGGMLTALTLIGCAMIGTAGAYGYRTYYVGPRPSSSTPVIVADKTPTKVVPASDAQSSKVIQDRVGDVAAAERVVPREEQPVVLKAPTPPAAVPSTAWPAAAPAPAWPASTASIEPPAAAPPVVAQAAPQPALVAPPPSAAASEPKRVRTVTIRADGSDVSGRPAGATTTVPRTAPAPKAARGGPLQLDPQQLSQPAPAPSAPVTPPAPRLASVPPSGGSGGYVVQVSSQKSEAEAQASFRSMQAKYPGAFNGRAPIIRRADLGAKGIFYRALVGPFPNAGDAGHFCSSLKAAGGQCIVQKN